MKKTIIGIIVTMVVTTGVSYGYVRNLNQKYEAEIAECNEVIDGLNQKIKTINSEKESEIAELEKQIYRIMEDEDFMVTVYGEDGNYHYYEKTGKGLFKKLNHVITYGFSQKLSQ